jgi:heme o synthase
MSDTAVPMNTAESGREIAAPVARFGDYLELTKPRLSLLSVSTAVVGYFAALPAWDGPKFFFLLLGTCFAAAGVAALNQWMESDTDALMERTANRPIPAGKIATGSAFVLGWGFVILGLAFLFGKVNGLSASFALATIVSYLACYTPAKRWSRWSTEIGAVAGAFPPLIGWAASENHDPVLGAILFGILLFWQIPHFMAIGWIYRAEYQRVQFPMLPVRDHRGGKVAGWSLVNTIAAVVVSALPTFFGFTGKAYAIFTVLLGSWFIVRGAAFLRPANRDLSARKLFLASVGWLPLQLLALVADRCLGAA